MEHTFHRVLAPRRGAKAKGFRASPTPEHQSDDRLEFVVAHDRITLQKPHWVPVIGGNLLWGSYPKDIVWKKFFSDALFNLVTILLIASMIAVLG